MRAILALRSVYLGHRQQKIVLHICTFGIFQVFSIKPSWENSPLVNISLIISGGNNKEIMQILSKRKYVGYWIVIFPFICSFGMTCYASSAYWPTEGWRTATPEEQGMHSNILAEMLCGK
jgi:hypothetical protein